jgi:NADPH:quinone reductase-like Zn-dependent oxidoreductase
MLLSVNAIDWKARAGYLKDVFPLALPYIPGWDVSGIVEAIGPGVTHSRKAMRSMLSRKAPTAAKALMRNMSWLREGKPP